MSDKEFKAMRNEEFDFNAPNSLKRSLTLRVSEGNGSFE
jgi:hypothetical protein